MSFHLYNETDQNHPRYPYKKIKDHVLGTKYNLSLVVVSKERIQSLNKQYRSINESTDILSFPLSDTHGEIYMNIEETKEMAKKFHRTYRNFFAYLFIHGLVHLKGYAHGSTMEALEERIRKHFRI